MKKKLFFVALAMLFVNLSAFSIEENFDPILLDIDKNEEEQLEDSSVSPIIWGTKKNEIYTLDNYSQDELSSSANIDTIKEDEIRKQGFPTLTQILNETSSLTTQTANGSDGSVTSVRIRGTDRVRMTIDGIRSDRPSMTTPGAESQFILTDDLEAIEVIKGPQGNVSGTNASGGAIAMRTRRGRGPFKFELGSDFGNKSTFKERAAIMGGNEKSDYYFSTTWYKTDGGLRTKNMGDIKNDSYNNLSMVSNLGYRLLNNKAEIRNVFRFSRARKDLGIGSNSSTWQNYQDPNNYSRNIDVMDSITFSHAPNEAYDYNLRFGVLHNRNNNYILSDIIDPNYNEVAKLKSTRLNLMTQHNFKYKKWNTLSLGYNLENEYINGNTDTYADNWLGVNTWQQPYSGSTLQNDVYVHDVVNIKDKLFLRGGARFFNNSDFGSYITPNGSVALVLPTFKLQGAKTKFKGSWGQSVNTPTLYQRFGYLNSNGMVLLPNHNLRAEKLTGYDFGIEQYFMDEKLRFELNYFNSDYKDYIGYNDLGMDAYYNFVGTYHNVDKARIFGYEGKMIFEPNDKFKISFNYTYTDSEDKMTGKDLPAVPRNRFNTTLYYTPFERWTIYAGVTTASSRLAPREKTSGFVDARIGTSVRLFNVKNLAFFLRANIYNLLNQDICMYSTGSDLYYSPKIRYNVGLFVEYQHKDKKKEEAEKV